jgi:hypothetical protein
VAGGLEHAGNFLSVASAVISIVQGFNTFSQGWAQNDEYMMRSGALQIASGVLVIIGVCCEIPVLQGAALFLSLLIVINEYERQQSRRLGYSHRLILGILKELHDHRQPHLRALGVENHVLQLRNMIMPQWMVEEEHVELPRYQPRWSWFGPHSDQLRFSGPRGGLVGAWAMYLRNAGFTNDQIRQIMGGFASPHIR